MSSSTLPQVLRNSTGTYALLSKSSLDSRKQRRNRGYEKFPEHLLRRELGLTHQEWTAALRELENAGLIETKLNGKYIRFVPEVR